MFKTLPHRMYYNVHVLLLLWLYVDGVLKAMQLWMITLKFLYLPYYAMQQAIVYGESWFCRKFLMFHTRMHILHITMCIKYAKICLKFSFLVVVREKFKHQQVIYIVNIQQNAIQAQMRNGKVFSLWVFME